MRRFVRCWDIGLFSLALVAASVPLVLWGRPPVELAWSPAAIGSGEWWRLFTHPFVHVSRYHLLLDGAAFVTLLVGLTDRRPGERIALVVASGAASLVAASLVPGATATYGLCGLSGVGHGLMAGSLVLSLQDEHGPNRRIAAAMLCVLVTKAVVEAATGRLFFELVHLGDLGRPNRLCHVGGVVGGTLAAFVISVRAPRRRVAISCPVVVDARGIIEDDARPVGDGGPRRLVDDGAQQGLPLFRAIRPVQHSPAQPGLRPATRCRKALCRRSGTACRP